jgi:hypothetical protein
LAEHVKPRRPKGLYLSKKPFKVKEVPGGEWSKNMVERMNHMANDPEYEKEVNTIICLSLGQKNVP